MKINNFGASGVNPYKRQMNKLDQVDKLANKAADKVEISTEAKEMQHVTQIENERQAKVEELKIQVENGTYKVNPKEVARGIYQFYFKK
ncbi:flagellar biosynthesis anti-sigma factor FlgM [Cytobacillus dafuensis]|uniref:Negative regulator of flagellin synthesis n=1 Tax=Cytobacillus dafuensis TaxID=1742359 RepID=A0A5B8Z9G1_CYTDA|nr:flagellar biosynthesis anti-sigma factor FlgM [Cytobacillus dafuensis]QED49608.1 flagellar biosynthesis anti-sigma factor FlgM [Cytobacillus dafuensis]